VSQALDEIKIGGLGASRKRVEDNRFIRGKGNYTDDIVLPGMLHMEILRSPLAHARIKSIDASKAWEIPGVRMVLTGETTPRPCWPRTRCASRARKWPA
jgi:carbon-monoxide dehydrogenase large subunit